MKPQTPALFRENHPDPPINLPALQLFIALNVPRSGGFLFANADEIRCICAFSWEPVALPCAAPEAEPGLPPQPPALGGPDGRCEAGTPPSLCPAGLLREGGFPKPWRGVPWYRTEAGWV